MKSYLPHNKPIKMRPPRYSTYSDACHATYLQEILRLHLLSLCVLLLLPMCVILRSRIENIEETLTRVTNFQYTGHIPASIAVIRSTPNSGKSVFVKDLVPFLA